MLSQAVERLLAYSPEQLFDLAADVERYPEFLRWWIAVRIRKREGEAYYTDQILGFGPIRIRFDSRTALHRPRRIDVTSDRPPFREFKLAWTFEPRPGGCCRAGLAAELRFRSFLMQQIVGQILPTAIDDIITAFEARARLLYGNAGPID
jgi:coenzyme Q-binding protein COQ10